MSNLTDKKAFICDMDGVIYHGNTSCFRESRNLSDWLRKEEKKFLFPDQRQSALAA